MKRADFDAVALQIDAGDRFAIELPNHIANELPDRHGQGLAHAREVSGKSAWCTRGCVLDTARRRHERGIG